MKIKLKSVCVDHGIMIDDLSVVVEIEVDDAKVSEIKRLVEETTPGLGDNKLVRIELVGSSSPLCSCKTFTEYVLYKMRCLLDWAIRQKRGDRESWF